MIIRRMSPTWGWSSALRGLDELHRELDQVFDSLTGLTGPRTAGVYPAINVSEDSETVFVRAELPGLRPGDLDLSVEGNTLTISGERKIAREGEQASYHRREREGGKFSRSLELPVRIDSENVQALFRNGILTVQLPKAAEARPRQIAIQAH